MNKITYLSVLGVAFVAAGCASTGNTPTAGRSKYPTEQTITLKNPLYLQNSGDADTGRLFKVNSVKGQGYASLKTTDGELWLALTKGMGFMSRDEVYMPVADIGQIKYRYVSKDDRASNSIFVSPKEQKATQVNQMLGFLHGKFVVCESGVRPDQDKSRCIDATDAHATYVYSTDRLAAKEQRDLFSFDNFLGGAQFLTESEYKDKRVKQAEAHKRVADRQAKADEEKAKQAAAEHAREQEFLGKAKKGTQEFCQTTLVYEPSVQLGPATFFQCNRAGYRGMGELLAFGWTVQSVQKQPAVSALGIQGWTASLMIVKTK